MPLLEPDDLDEMMPLVELELTLPLLVFLLAGVGDTALPVFLDGSRPLRGVTEPTVLSPLGVKIVHWIIGRVNILVHVVTDGVLGDESPDLGAVVPGPQVDVAGLLVVVFTAIAEGIWQPLHPGPAHCQRRHSCNPGSLRRPCQSAVSRCTPVE